MGARRSSLDELEAGAIARRSSLDELEAGARAQRSSLDDLHVGALLGEVAPTRLLDYLPDVPTSGPLTRRRRVGVSP